MLASDSQAYTGLCPVAETDTSPAGRLMAERELKVLIHNCILVMKVVILPEYTFTFYYEFFPGLDIEPKTWQGLCTLYSVLCQGLHHFF